MPTTVTPSLDHWTTLFLLASVQGLFLSLLLFLHKKGNLRANKILATLVLSFSIMLLYYVSYWSGFAVKYPWLNWWTEPVVFLFGPLTYFYIQMLEQNTLQKNYRLHFIPAIITFIWVIPFLLRVFFGHIYWLGKYFFSHSDFISYGQLTSVILQNISLAGYAVTMFWFLRNDFLRLNQHATKEEHDKHQWLKKVVWFYSGFAFAAISYWLLVWAGLLKVEYDYMISVTMSVFIYMVGYLGFRQPEIFHGYANMNGRKTDQKYAKSSLKADQARPLMEKLLIVMDVEKPYLDSELKIQHLADKVGISSHHLSQIINEYMNQNYADFINSYRIKEASRLLLSPGYEQEKILSVAFDSGFHNKATFNAAFKKYTGMSPSEFKKYHQRILVN